jgi:hypothetical protein
VISVMLKTPSKQKRKRRAPRTEHRNGHFHRSADGYSDPDSVVDALEDLANWITVLHVNRAKSAA